MKTTTMNAIHTDQAPKAVGPYSQAVRAGEYLFLSGQIALDPASGNVVGSDIEAQTRQVMSNVRAIVEAGGRKMSDVARIGVYLTDLADFQKFNAVYETFFGPHRPARTTVQVSALPKGVRLEIDAVVFCGGGAAS